jgi:CRISPR-associated endoribonuclease Cas6
MEQKRIFMDNPIAPTGPVKLYALQLRLRPLQYGTLMPFNGELVHGAFLRWLRGAAPEVVSWLHEGQKRRLFTCSSLHFPRFEARLLDMERRNTHLPLEPEDTYTVRLTLLLGELFPLFHEALLNVSSHSMSGARPPFIQLGKQLLLLEEVQITNDEPAGWTGFTSLNSLIEQAREVKFHRETSLTLEFASLTAFSRSNGKTGYGEHQFMLPLPQMVFQNLVRRWEDIAPPELLSIVQRQRIEAYLQADGAIIIDYDLKAHHVHFTTHLQRGFLGTCTYQLRTRGGDESTSEEAPLTIRQQLHLLARLAFYSGVGYKTAMGMGQARLKA